MDRHSFRADLAAVFIGMFGYFGYYQKTGESLWFWAGMILIGIIAMAAGDFYYYAQTESLTVLWDLPVLVIMFILAEYIESYGGLSLLAALVLCFWYGFVSKKHRKNMLRETERNKR